MQGRAILFSEMTPDAAWENDFNEWYDGEHIPLRMAVPGFRSAQRYRMEGTLNYLVVYEMDSPAVLKSPAYLAVKNNPSDRTRWMLRSVTGFTRYIAEETDMKILVSNAEQALNAPVLYPVFSEVQLQSYEGEHLMVRRFKIADGEPESWTYLALHYLNAVPAEQSLRVYLKHGSRHEDSQILHIY